MGMRLFLKRNDLFSKENINSFCLAIIICSNSLSWLIPINNIIIYIIAFIALIFILNNGPLFFLSVLNVYICIGIISFLFLLSFAFNTLNSHWLFYYLDSFTIFGLTGLFFSQSVFSYKKLFGSILTLAFIVMPLFFLTNTNYGIDKLSISNSSSLFMGVSYGVLPYLIAGLFILFNRDSKILTKILSLIVISGYGYIYLNYGSRGAVLSIIILILLLVLFKIRSSIGKISLIFLILSLGSVVYYNFYSLVISVKQILNLYNINFLALNKVIALSSKGDLLNGRGNLFENALVGIQNSPLLGNGIGSYESLYGGYVHNLFLQVTYEGGIILLIIILFLIFRFFWLSLFDKEIDQSYRIILIYLFCSGVLELFFSNTLWRSQIFWLWLGFLLIDKNKLKRSGLKDEVQG